MGLGVILRGSPKQSGDSLTSARHAAKWISSLENHVPPALWHRSIEEIEPPELLQALADIRPHERARKLTQGDRVVETMQRARQRLDAVFEGAIFRRRCITEPAAAVRRKTRRPFSPRCPIAKPPPGWPGCAQLRGPQRERSNSLS